MWYEELDSENFYSWNIYEQYDWNENQRRRKREAGVLDKQMTPVQNPAVGLLVMFL